MGHEITSFDDDYEWVKVKGLQRFNITGSRNGRPWSQGKNVSISKGEELILPRGKVGEDGYAEGMKFYFENDGFLKVVNSNPKNVENGSQEVFDCEECGRDFDSRQGLRAHTRQKHENNNKEDG